MTKAILVKRDLVIAPKKSKADDPIGRRANERF